MLSGIEDSWDSDSEGDESVKPAPEKLASVKFPPEESDSAESNYVEPDSVEPEKFFPGWEFVKNWTPIPGFDEPSREFLMNRMRQIRDECEAEYIAEYFKGQEAWKTKAHSDSLNRKGSKDHSPEGLPHKADHHESRSSRPSVPKGKLTNKSSSSGCHPEKQTSKSDASKGSKGSKGFLATGANLHNFVCEIELTAATSINISGTWDRMSSDCEEVKELLKYGLTMEKEVLFKYPSTGQIAKVMIDNAAKRAKFIEFLTTKITPDAEISWVQTDWKFKSNLIMFTWGPRPDFAVYMTRICVFTDSEPNQ